MGKNNTKLTTEEFIKKARKVHGDKYDYSKVVYVNNHTKVCIICPEHGEFWQEPSSHLMGRGCPKCAGKERLTTEEFVRKASAIHGGKYDYSKIEYVNYQTKVCIICPIHGEFWQTPINHLKGKGCPDCYGNRKSSKEKFIEEAREIHGDKYDYSKVEYKNTDIPVCIICPIHGEFWQTPYHHIKRKQGCPKCGGKVRLTTEEFIKRAIEIHGNKYDYSKVEYVNNRTPVCIICPEHGEFWQSPSGHLSGKGCPKCAGKYLTTKDFIVRARKVHGNKYDYSKVIYVDMDTPVCIICPIHGEFWQKPSDHLNRHNCPKCQESFFESKVRNILERNNIIYEKEKKFEWLKNKGKLRLDFYLPKYNVALECQGCNTINL